MIEDDIHDQLTKAYMEYFKANNAFESRKSHRTHASSRRWLRRNREVANLRMDDIDDAQTLNKGAEKKGDK